MFMDAVSVVLHGMLPTVSGTGCHQQQGKRGERAQHHGHGEAGSSARES
jgi:hypothetical protein